jgi:phosphatidate cytidylyltransferase
MLVRIATGAVALLIFIPVLFFSHTIVFPVSIVFVALIAVAELFKCVGVFTRKNISKKDIMLCLGITVYIITAFASIVITRKLPGGEYFYLLIFIGAWVTDTFAYFTGRLFGRHKLAPVISPNKTIEGAVGGTVFCSLAFVLYGFIIAEQPNYIFLACAGVVISVTAVFGDLMMSAIKRKYGIKDFGVIFPGHGGILDRFDSVMAAAPAIMIIAIIFSGFDCGLFI